MPLKNPPRISREPRAIREINCSSWEDFKFQLRSEREGGEVDRLYRGHARADWRLTSPWERGLEWKGIRNEEEETRILGQLLENFKDMTIGLPGIRTLDLQADSDWWTLGRHYGLATPLLDWTRSPYVAAFFAFTTLLEQVSPGATTLGSINLDELLSSKRSEQVAIWSLGTQRLSSDGGLHGLEIVNSRTDIGHRQRAQRGAFTRLTQGKHRCLEDYLESLHPEYPPLRKYLIPGREASAAISELRLMNITFATLFPDLVGAALQANFEMAMWIIGLLAPMTPNDWDSIVGSKEDTLVQNQEPVKKVAIDPSVRLRLS